MIPRDSRRRQMNQRPRVLKRPWWGVQWDIRSGVGSAHITTDIPSSPYACRVRNARIRGLRAGRRQSTTGGPAAAWARGWAGGGCEEDRPRGRRARASCLPRAPPSQSTGQKRLWERDERGLGSREDFVNVVVGAKPQPPHIRFSSTGKALFHHPARAGPPGRSDRCRVHWARRAWPGACSRRRCHRLGRNRQALGFRPRWLAG